MEGGMVRGYDKEEEEEVNLSLLFRDKASFRSLSDIDIDIV